MSFRIINIRYVPRDEEVALKAALKKKRVHYYETPRGPRSGPELWVRDEESARKAVGVIFEFQNRWQASAKKRNNNGGNINHRDISKYIILVITILIVLIATNFGVFL